MNTKDRSLFIDVLKGLLIILVVIGHFSFFEYESRTEALIYSFHMPAFLIIGGILSHIDEKATFLDILKKRVRNILVPYFVFYFICLVFVPCDSLEKKLSAILVVFTGIGDPDRAINLPLWFLTFYFCALTFYEFIECALYKLKLMLFGKKTLHNTNTHLLFIRFFTFLTVMFFIFVAWWYARVLKGPRLIFNIEIALFSLGFIFFGKLLSDFVPELINHLKQSTFATAFMLFATAIVISIFIIFWYYFSMKNGRIDLNARQYKNSFLLYTNAILGFIIFAFFSFVISYIPVVNNVLAYIGENSIYVLAYHIPSTIITYGIIIPIFPVLAPIVMVNSPLSIFLLAFFGVSISLIIGLIHKLIRFPIRPKS